MQNCTVCNAQSPDTAMNCVNCNADLSIDSETAVALKNFQKNPRVRQVRIVVADNCCPACREMYGTYKKDAVPYLPVEGCSHANGCRCFYQPFLDDIYP